MAGTEDAMCDACARLVGGGRRTSPHSKLQKIGELREFAAYGSRADEQRYECTDCGKKWLHESGNAGYGWM